MTKVAPTSTPTPTPTETPAAAPATAPLAERTIDPHAVRVALTPALAHLDLPAMVVEPLASPGGDDLVDLIVDGVPSRARLAGRGTGRALLEADQTPGDGAQAIVATRLILEERETTADGRGIIRREVVVDGWRIELEIESERRAALRDRARRGREESTRGGPTEVHAIIPGRIVSVSVAAGDGVVASQQLLVVEAMKMQNELRAPRDGVVSGVAVAAGDTIEIGDLLLVIE